MTTKLICVAGARPNFTKIAPLIRELDADPDFEVLFVHTGQHYDDAMSEAFFRDLRLRDPDCNLGVGSDRTPSRPLKLFAASSQSWSGTNPKEWWWWEM